MEEEMKAVAAGAGGGGSSRCRWRHQPESERARSTGKGVRHSVTDAVSCSKINTVIGLSLYHKLRF
jgi:hypothetical protein